MSTYEIANPLALKLAAVAKLIKLPESDGTVGTFGGSGVYIGPHQVLTAAHVVYYERLGTLPDAVFVGPAVDAEALVDGAASLPDRSQLPGSTSELGVDAVKLIRGYDNTGGLYDYRDIALLSSADLSNGHGAISLGVSWAPQIWRGVPAESAGFPGEQEIDERFDGRTLFVTTDALKTSEDYDFIHDTQFIGFTSYGGQSGSGVWILDPVTGDQVLLGILTTKNADHIGGGVFLTASDYLTIAAAFAETGVTAEQAPIEYLYGSDNGSLLGGGDVETITGTYLREIIRGDSVTGLGAFAGNDRLTGGGGSDVLQGMAGDDSLVGDGAGVSGVQIGNDFLDGGQNTLTFGQDTVLAGVDHTLATTIEIGHKSAHEDAFEAAGFPGVALTDDVVVIEGTGGTDFVRNVETISLVKSGSDTTTDTLKLYAFDAAAVGRVHDYAHQLAA